MTAAKISADPSVKWAEFRLIYALDRLKLALKAYDPDQPRAPSGTEEGGQWIAVDGPLGLIQLAGGFDGVSGNMKVQDFVAQMCKGRIYSELPRQFLPLTLDELIAARKARIEGAATCFKLLHRREYRK